MRVRREVFCLSSWCIFNCGVSLFFICMSFFLSFFIYLFIYLKIYLFIYLFLDYLRFLCGTEVAWSFNSFVLGCLRAVLCGMPTAVAQK